MSSAAVPAGLWDDANRQVGAAWRQLIGPVMAGDASPGDGDLMISVGLPGGLVADLYVSRGGSAAPLRPGQIGPVMASRR